MTDLREFLTARYDEDEAVARHLDEHSSGHDRPYNPTDPTDPARVLADIAAKRRMLGRHRVPTKSEWQRWHARMCLGCGAMGEFDDPRVREINECPELRDLASPYAEHADFQSEWRLHD